MWFLPSFSIRCAGRREVPAYNPRGFPLPSPSLPPAGPVRAAPARRSNTAMGLDPVPTGKNPPDEINVIIEIPKDAEPVKYEVDKASGAIFVDRVLSTPMRYPCNYGYVPHTLCGDGDPADVLVLMPLQLIPGSVIRVRPVGVLRMSDEAGADTKLLAVPIDKVYPGYAHMVGLNDVPQHWRDRISYFFEHYKDLEAGKWVELDGWGDVAEAKQILVESVTRYNASEEKPNF